MRNTTLHRSSKGFTRQTGSRAVNLDPRTLQGALIPERCAGKARGQLTASQAATKPNELVAQCNSIVVFKPRPR